VAHQQRGAPALWRTCHQEQHHLVGGPHRQDKDRARVAMAATAAIDFSSGDAAEAGGCKGPSGGGDAAAGVPLQTSQAGLNLNPQL
jgi:hypothetical protein